MQRSRNLKNDKTQYKERNGNLSYLFWKRGAKQKRLYMCIVSKVSQTVISASGTAVCTDQSVNIKTNQLYKRLRHEL